MKKFVCALFLCVALSSPLFSSWGFGARAGSVNGITMQFRFEQFDFIAACNYGLLDGGWSAFEAGVNFQVLEFDWSPGTWEWRLGAVSDFGYHFGDAGFFFGAFAPSRLCYTFPSAPWTVYLEFAPGVDVVPKTGFDMALCLGATYLVSFH